MPRCPRLSRVRVVAQVRAIVPVERLTHHCCALPRSRAGSSAFLLSDSLRRAVLDTTARVALSHARRHGDVAHRTSFHYSTHTAFNHYLSSLLCLARALQLLALFAAAP